MSKEKFNSELEICSKCGKVLEFCVCSSEKKDPDRVIRIESVKLADEKNPQSNKDILAQLAAEKAKRQSYENVIALQAEKTFMEEKEAILDQIPESRRDSIAEKIGDDPSVLEAIKLDLLLHGSPEPSKQRRGGQGPAGKVSLPIRDDSAIQSSGNMTEEQRFIDDLFKQSKTHPDPKVRQNAERKIDSLFEAYGEGFSSREKNYSASGRRKTTVTQCLKCGGILMNEDAKAFLANKGCNYCGWSGKGFVKYPQGQPY